MFGGGCCSSGLSCSRSNVYIFRRCGENGDWCLDGEFCRGPDGHMTFYRLPVTHPVCTSRVPDCGTCSGCSSCASSSSPPPFSFSLCASTHFPPPPLPSLFVCISKRKKKVWNKKSHQTLLFILIQSFALERDFFPSKFRPEFERQIWLFEWGTWTLRLIWPIVWISTAIMRCKMAWRPAVYWNWSDVYWNGKLMFFFSSLFLSYFTRKWIAFQRWFVSEKHVCCFMKFCCQSQAFLLSDILERPFPPSSIGQSAVLL